MDMTDRLSTHTNTHRQTKESRSLQTDRKPHILGEKGPKIRQKKWENAYKCKFLLTVFSLQ